MTSKCLTALIVAVSLSGCTQRTPEQQLIHDVGEALGGAGDIAETETLLLEGKGTEYLLGQNVRPDSNLSFWEIDEYRREVDLANTRWRATLIRSTAFLTGNPTIDQEATSGVDGDVAYDVSEDGEVTRLTSGIVDERMTAYSHHPATLVQVALSEGSMLTNLRQEDGEAVIDITTDAGKTYAMYVDPETNYPTRIESLEYHPNLGDVTLATHFEDYWETGGFGGFQARLTMPREVTTTVDGVTTRHLRVTTAIGQDLPDVGAPEGARSAEAREFEAHVEVEEVADGAWHLTGQSHHSVLVEFDDYLALVEAPQNEARTLAVIAKARELQPDKPLQYVVNTHHHFDHSAGLRAAVSEGLTVITHASNEALYRDLAQRSHSRRPDALTENPQELSLELVEGHEVYELTNGRRTMHIGRVSGDAHASALLMAHLPRERILIVADAFSPDAETAPFARNLLEVVNRLEWRTDRIVPIHGPVVEFAALEEAAGTD